MGAIIYSDRWRRSIKGPARVLKPPPSISATSSFSARPLCSRPVLPSPRRIAVILVWALIGADLAEPVYPAERSDLEEEGLAGPVQAVQTTESLLTQTDRFDRQGRLVDRVQGAQQALQGWWPLHFRYRYDEAGRRVAEEVRDARGGLVKETRFAYDDDGSRSAEVAVWSDGTFENASLYGYDANRRRVRAIHYNAQQIINRNSYLFDAAGRLTRERLERNYGYDADRGRVTKSAEFDLGYEVALRYDDQGRIQEKIVSDLDGHLQGRSEFSYDDHGNQIEERIFKADGRASDRKTYRYEYDAAGNWIMEAFQWWRVHGEREALQQFHIRERTLSYFPTP